MIAWQVRTGPRCVSAHNVLPWAEHYRVFFLAAVSPHEACARRMWACPTMPTWSRPTRDYLVPGGPSLRPSCCACSPTHLRVAPHVDGHARGVGHERELVDEQHRLHHAQRPLVLPQAALQHGRDLLAARQPFDIVLELQQRGGRGERRRRRRRGRRCRDRPPHRRRRHARSRCWSCWSCRSCSRRLPGCSMRGRCLLLLLALGRGLNARACRGGGRRAVPLRLGGCLRWCCRWLAL